MVTTKDSSITDLMASREEMSNDIKTPPAHVPVAISYILVKGKRGEIEVKCQPEWRNTWEGVGRGGGLHDVVENNILDWRTQSWGSGPALCDLAEAT